jgi:hypothetical protein
VGSLRKSLPVLNKVPQDGCVLAGVIRRGVARGLTGDNDPPGAQANKFKEVA